MWHCNAANRKNSTCINTNTTTGSVACTKIAKTTAMARMGTARLLVNSAFLECLLNAITNVKRYSASGSTQSRGTLATSVVMKFVTPSIKLEGTNDRPIHFQTVARVTDVV